MPLFRVRHWCLIMAWNMRPCLDPNNFMLMQATEGGGGSGTDALLTVLNSCPLPSLRGLQDGSRMSNNIGKRPFYGMFDCYQDDMEEKNMAEFGNPISNLQLEKKRRLSVEQVRSLEKSFEMENKLEPERKMQLAQQLGLQPRQVAVWFQNRRARWKTKQLEHVYDALKQDFETVLAEKEKLKAEVAQLTAKLETYTKNGITGNGLGLNKIKADSSEQEEYVKTNVDRAVAEPSHSLSEVEKPVQAESCMQDEVSKKIKDFSGSSDTSTENGDTRSSQAAYTDEPSLVRLPETSHGKSMNAMYNEQEINQIKLKYDDGEEEFYIGNSYINMLRFDDSFNSVPWC